MENRHEIDWASTVVKADGTLLVDLAGQADKRFRQVFNSVADRIARQGHAQPWSNVSARVTKDTDRLVIKQLELELDDHVDLVRAHLTALVAQANATVADERAPRKQEHTDPREAAAQASMASFRRLAENDRAIDG